MKSSTTSGALKTWVLDTILYQVIGSAVHGAVIGYIALRALRYSSEKNWIDKESFLLWAVGLALFTMGTGGEPCCRDLRVPAKNEEKNASLTFLLNHLNRNARN